MICENKALQLDWSPLGMLPECNVIEILTEINFLYNLFGQVAVFSRNFEQFS
jgi:hypothetical protein